MHKESIVDEVAIFTKVIALDSTAEREEYLKRACVDAAVRGRIERLLRLHGQSNLKADQLVVKLGDLAVGRFGAVAQVGDAIGPYRLLEQIGDGGMGVVCMAEQQKPVRRRVALKIIKAGMDTKQVIARFEAERQALALMEHENIARVLDAGETDSGRPYFVMELVDGVPITEYCQRENVTTTERLALFIATCRAVQHAHLKGIIHRDIKPSNVMVTLHDDVPVVKMIDFGIAKATNQNLTEKTPLTNHSQLVGTPMYMSPEQAELSGLDVDTRSDVYSLGVLLYELLTDTTPFDEERFRTVPHDEMRRIIREEDPPKPSDRISTVTASHETLTVQRRSHLEQRGRATRGELDWIVIKALDKDRTRRYQSANDFADDVQRHLNGEDVAACPPSTTYRLKKFVSRHRTSVVTGLTFATLLMVGLMVTTWLAIKARNAETLANARLASEKQARENEAEALKAETEQREAADKARAEAEAIARYLRDDLLMQAHTDRGQNAGITLRTALDRAAGQLEGRFDDQPLVEASIRHTLGIVYTSMRELRKAEPQNRVALAIRLKHLGKDDLLVQKTRYSLALCLKMQARFKESAELFEQAYHSRQRSQGVEHPETYATLRALLKALLEGKLYSRADPLAAEAMTIAPRTFGEDSVESIEAMHFQSQVLWHLGKRDELKVLVERSRRLREKLDRSESLTGEVLAAFAQLAYSQGEYEEAAALFERAIEQAGGNDKVEDYLLLARLAVAYIKLRRYPEAADLLEQVVKRSEEVYGPDGPGMVNSLLNLAWARSLTKEHVDTERAASRAFEISSRTFGNDHPNTKNAVSILTTLLNKQASAYEATGELERALEARLKELDLRRKLTIQGQPPCNCMLNVTRLFVKLKRFDEAEQMMRECVKLSEESPEEASVTTRALGMLGEVLTARKKYEEAEMILLKKSRGP